MSPAESRELLASSHGSDSSELTSSFDSLKSSGPPAVDINSDALSTENVLMTFSLSYFGMISTETKSLSPADLDKLIDMMQRRNAERQREETLTSDNPSVSKNIAPVTRSPNLRAKKKMKSDIGPTISIVAVDETPRKNRASSFNEQKKEPLPSKRNKVHSFDGSLSLEQSGQRQEQSKQNGQHSEIVENVNHPADDSTVEDVTAVKARTELAASKELPKRSVVLILTSGTIALQDANDNKTIRKKKVTEIASCTQVGVPCIKASPVLIENLCYCHYK